MPRFRQLKKCKFWQVKGGRYFWYGGGEVTGMKDLERYCKDMVKAVAIDPAWADSDEYVPAAVRGDHVYPFNPGDTVYTFADSIVSKDDNNKAT